VEAEKILNDGKPFPRTASPSAIPRPENELVGGASLGAAASLGVLSDDYAKQIVEDIEDLIGAGNFSEALRRAEEALADDLYARNPALWTQKATALWRQGKQYKALKAAGKAHELDRFDDKPLRLMAQILTELGGRENFRKARDAIKTAIFLNPDAMENRVIEIQLLKKRGRLDQAMELVKRAIKRWPSEAKLDDLKRELLDESGPSAASLGKAVVKAPISEIISYWKSNRRLIDSIWLGGPTEGVSSQMYRSFLSALKQAKRLSEDPMA